MKTILGDPMKNKKRSYEKYQDILCAFWIQRSQFTSPTSASVSHQ